MKTWSLVLTAVLLLYVTPPPAAGLDDYFPTLKPGLWYNYTFSENHTGSFVNLTIEEFVFVKIEHVSVSGSVYTVRVCVYTERYVNGTLESKGSAYFNVNLPEEELPDTPLVLNYFYNAKDPRGAVLEYLEGLRGVLPNASTLKLEVHYDVYTFGSQERQVVVGMFNGTEYQHGGLVEKYQAELIVDNQTGLLLEWVRVRRRYALVSAESLFALPVEVSIMRTVLTATNLFRVSLTGLKTPRMLFLLLTMPVAIVMVVVVVYVLKFKHSH